MQLVPETASRFNVGNPYDVKDNLRGGLAYLRWLLAYYRGQVALAAAAYNAGEAAVDRYRGIPPFPETRDYVRRVLRLFRNEWHAFDPARRRALAVPDRRGRRGTVGDRNAPACRRLGSHWLRVVAWGALCAIAGSASAEDATAAIGRVKGSIVAIGTYERTRTPQFQFRGTGFASATAR